MAIKTIKEQLVLKLELDAGTVGDKQKISSRSFSKIKKDAADEALHATALSLGSLQEDSLLNVKKVETSNLLVE